MLISDIAQTDLITVTPEASLASDAAPLESQGRPPSPRRSSMGGWSASSPIATSNPCLALSSGLEGLDRYRSAGQIMTRDPITIAPATPVERSRTPHAVCPDRRAAGGARTPG